MEHKSEMSRRVLVQEVVSGRYQGRPRPLSWDKRCAGIEKIVTSEGETLTLLSGGGQSTPKPGWELLLVRTAEEKDYQVQCLKPTEEQALTWTLYGIRPREQNS